MSKSEDDSIPEELHHVSCSGQWNSILSQVQNELPGMDSDLETSCSDDEATDTIFNPTGKSCECVSRKGEPDDSNALQSPFPLKINHSWHTSKAQPPSITQSTSLLFQRLQTHLKENLHSRCADEDAISTDAKIDRVDRSYSNNARSVPSHETDTMLDVPFGLAHSSSTDSAVFGRDDGDLSSEFDLDGAPMLSLQKLEKYELDNFLDDSTLASQSLPTSAAPSSKKNANERSKIMMKLVDLSDRQKRLNNSYGDNNLSLSSHDALKSFKETGMEKEERSTIFLDLRPREKSATENDSVLNSETCADTRTQQTKSVGVSSNDLSCSSKRVQSLAKMRLSSRYNSESDSDDEDYQGWKRFRQSIKEKSALPSASSLRSPDLGTPKSKILEKHEVEEIKNVRSSLFTEQTLNLHKNGSGGTHCNKKNGISNDTDTEIKFIATSVKPDVKINYHVPSKCPSNGVNAKQVSKTEPSEKLVAPKLRNGYGNKVPLINSVGKDVEDALSKLPSISINCITNEIGKASSTRSSCLNVAEDQKSDRKNSKEKPREKIAGNVTRKKSGHRDGRSPQQYVSDETRNKLKSILEKENEYRGTYLLYHMKSSFDHAVSGIPPTLNSSEAQMALLTINMASVGLVVTHRMSGGHKASTVDQSAGFSITYPLLLSWLLALVPEDLNKLHQARMDDTFALDIDILSEKSNGKDPSSLPINVDVPFNVVSLNQYWQEDTKSFSLVAVIIPNFFYKPESKRGRKKSIKREDAFLHAVRQFLQSNKIQDVCPWYEKPESPLHYILSETILTYASKPMSTYVSATNDSLTIKKALESKPSFFTKVVSPDGFVCSPKISNHKKTEMTMCLLQQEAFMCPTVVLDIAIRLQTSCFDMAGLRLCYVSKKFINENSSPYNFAEEFEHHDDIVPCAVMAISGKSAHAKWSKIVGPKDPVLARMSERSSLSATYGEQLSGKRGNEFLSSGISMFHHPRNQAKAFEQLCLWFGGRADVESEMFKDLLQSAIVNGISDRPNMHGQNGSDKHSRNKSSCSKSAGWSPKGLTAHEELHQRPSFIVTSSNQKIYLVISPRLPTQYISDVLSIIVNHGFRVVGVKRLRLDEKKSSALCIPQSYNHCFCPRLDPDASIEFEYFEDVWQIRPCTVLLLAKENAMVHQAGLIHALQSELMVTLSPTDEEGQLKSVTYQCFHTTTFCETTEHSIGNMVKTSEVEVGCGDSPFSCMSINTNPEIEQVVLLAVIGDQAIGWGVEVLRNLAHGDFPPVGNDCSSDHYYQEFANDAYSLYSEPFQGFEILGMKRLPTISKKLANELCPFEIGTAEWFDSILSLENNAVFIFILRRVNAFKALEKVLEYMRSPSCTELYPDHQNASLVMSSTPEIACRQVSIFFCDKELYPDNQSRPLLKYLPPPARILQYRSHQELKSRCSCGSICCTCLNGRNSSYSENLKKIPTKKKKRQVRREISHKDSIQNGDGTVSARHLSALDESIFSFMTTCNQPLTSVIVIKPDAFPRHFIKILRELHQEDFSFVAMNLIKMSEHEALQIAPSAFREMHGECQVYLDHMLSGLSLVACVKRTNAIKYLEELSGPYDPQTARNRCHWRHGSMQNRTRATLRALYGIDLISNGIHISDSYASACEETKLFFPNGLCCQETLELSMESVPCPAIDTYMCVEKMKGRAVRTTNPEKKIETVKREFEITGICCEPLAVVLLPALLQSSVSSNVEGPAFQRREIPPYVDILDQLLTQGFEICAMRMAWCRKAQSEEILNLLQQEENKEHYVNLLTRGPVLLLILQRKNALALFDSVLGSTRCNGNSLYHKYSKNVLRSRTLGQTEEAARYIFSNVPYANSVINISHHLMDWSLKIDPGFEGSKMESSNGYDL